jgi:peroxiredoxin
MGNYNYEHFSRELLEDLARTSFSGPEPGDRAPDFKATSLQGDSVQLSDFQDKQNVLLLFGSATCPMTAASIVEMNRLYEDFRGEDVEFLFVYVREAHPGERIPAHGEIDDKIAAAELLRREEGLQMPVLVDDLRGSIHRKYGQLPNPAFLIDKSGRIAFRSMWSNASEVAAAVEELLELQEERDTNHVVVRGGEDLSMPLSYSMIRSHRALERGGELSIVDFRAAFDRRGRGAARSRKRKPLVDNPSRALSITALTAAVLAGGLYAGFELRKRRLGLRRNPYRAYEKDEVRDTETGTDYGAVGI